MAQKDSGATIWTGRPFLLPQIYTFSDFDPHLYFNLNAVELLATESTEKNISREYTRMNANKNNKWKRKGRKGAEGAKSIIRNSLKPCLL